MPLAALFRFVFKPRGRIGRLPFRGEHQRHQLAGRCRVALGPMNVALTGRLILAIVLLGIFIGRSHAAAAETPTDQPINFNRDIRPILSDNCFHCHGPDAETREAGLRLDLGHAVSDAGVITPGDADSSELILRIEDGDDPMPPRDSQRSLSAQDRSLLKRWINEGAAFDEHWAFVPPERLPLPVVEAETLNPIDAFVAQKLEERGLQFSAEADPRTLIRRVSLDLTGLPPTPADVERFLGDYEHQGESAYQRLVDRLIQSPRYGETMALPWLDASRFADTDGYQYDGPRFQWRWRDWVIDAYNANMPFDQFTIEQLAGDLLPDATLDQKIATAFNRNHRYNSESGLVVEEFLLENAVDRVDTTSTLWMGLTIGCARCHDHKFDPISQRDYYQLIAFFNNVPEAGRAIKSGNSEPVVIAPTDQQAARLKELESQLASRRGRLRPGTLAQQGGLLIDRGLVGNHPLDKRPDENAKAEGHPTFADRSLVLDGDSTLELTGIDERFKLRADQKFSISLWVRCDETRDGVLLSRQNTGTTRPGVEVSLVEGGKVQFDLISRWVAGTGRATTRTRLRPNRWTHLVLTNDGSQSANGQHIYIDGIAVETDVKLNTNSNVGGVGANRPLILGGGIRPGSQRFRGAIRKVQLYDTLLWPEEIEILAAPYGGKKRKQFSRLKMTPEYASYRSAREAVERYSASLPTVMVMRESETQKTTHIRLRGVYDKYGDAVERDVPATLPPMPQHLPRNRLGFAKWLVSPDHPLTARVAVNRYWQKYFGRGLVKTPEDFGTQSELPTHPELLDWMATEFIRSGWDVARMQRLIVSSRTYRQSSATTAEQFQADPENRFLSRAPRLRLSGQAIRDQALAVSGLLSSRIGGPSVSPYQPDGLWAEMSMGMKYRQSEGEDLFRRSLYTIWKRTVAPPTMAVFDAADRESCWVSRKRTNTPLQALTLLNETGFVECARHLAARMCEQSDPIGYGFCTVVARQPSRSEREMLEQALRNFQSHYEENQKAAEELIRIGNSPSDSTTSPSRLAAHTALANVLLNLDETITRE